MEKLQWIRQRTEFIDGVLEGFLAAAPAGEPVQCVLIGAGYDTRALRFRRKDLQFFEVDLPSVLPIKRAMSTRYLEEQAAPTAGPRPAELGADLNEAAGQAGCRAPLPYSHLRFLAPHFPHSRRRCSCLRRFRAMFRPVLLAVVR